MNIYYSPNGIPVVVIDNIAYDFNNPDRGELLAQLAMNPEIINEIKEKTIEYLLSIDIPNFLNESKSYSNIKSLINILGQTQLFLIVLDTIEDAENTSLMISTPQPYPSWIWDGGIVKWIPPITYPENAPQGVYVWDENTISWVPSEISPYPSWVWNRIGLKWEPPVTYPLDAYPDQFKWDEENKTWVLNV